MNVNKWLIPICRMVVGIAVVLVVVIVLFLTGCSLGRQYEMTRVSGIYKSNDELYKNVVGDNAVIAYTVNRTKYYTVPKELLELGVEDIYSYDENIYFEHKEKVLWMFPQGIVYVKQLDNLPEWVILSRISGQWYYYRIVS